MNGQKEMVEKFIQCDPAIMMGKPVIAIEQILKAHPRLTEEAIRAALAFAAEAIRADVVYPIRKAI